MFSIAGCIHATSEWLFSWSKGKKFFRNSRGHSAARVCARDHAELSQRYLKQWPPAEVIDRIDSVSRVRISDCTSNKPHTHNIVWQFA
jgi:hypothetical protein